MSEKKAVNLHKLMEMIAKKEGKETKVVYGKYYKIFSKKYPDVSLSTESSKIKSIKAQGYEQKLIDILKESVPEAFEEIEELDKPFTDEQKIKIFEKELNLIGGSEITNNINDDIKKFTVRCLLKVPDYFYTTGASSTGKYHPYFSAGRGGLLRHTKALVKVALTLFEVEAFEFDERLRGIIIASGILHDACKLGMNNSAYTVDKHPEIICEFIIENVELEDFPEKDFEKMCSMIKSHMGKFNYSSKDKVKKKPILPKPSLKSEVFLHICDLIASRKWVDFDFSEEFKGL